METKTCTKCGKEYPRTAEFFHRSGYKNGNPQLRSRCRNCTIQEKREYYQDNRDELKAMSLARFYRNHEHNIERAHQYKKLHRIELSVKEKEYRLRHKEQYHQYYVNRHRRIISDEETHNTHLEYRRRHYKEWRKRTLAKRLEYEADYREKNRARLRINNLRWSRQNWHKTRAASERWRVRIKTAEGTHTAEDIRRIFDMQGGKCLYCGCELDSKYHLDHFIPLVHGGWNTSDNLVCACPDCNLSKGSKTPYSWPKWNGALPVEWKGRLL